MTDRDSATSSGGEVEERCSAGDAPPYVGQEIATSIREELVGGLAAVVAGDVGMEIEPDALDAVGVGAIGRQEVEHDASAQVAEQTQYSASLVHAVVVDDEMDAACARVVGREKSKQVTEQVGALFMRAGRMKLACPNVEGTREIELLVLTGRDDAPLVSPQHPVATDLRGEVDVDLVAIEHGLGGARASFELTDFGQTLQASVARPRAKHDRFGRTQSRPEPRKRSAHGAHGHRRPAVA